MDHEIGIVCSACDGFNAFGTAVCVLCQTVLAPLLSEKLPVAAGSMAPGPLTLADAPEATEPIGLPPFPAELPRPPEPVGEPLPMMAAGLAPPPSEIPPAPPSVAPSSEPTIHRAPRGADRLPQQGSAGPAGPIAPHPAPRIDDSAALFSEALRLRRSTPGEVMATNVPNQARPMSASHEPRRSSGSIPRPDPGGRPATAVRAPPSVFPSSSRDPGRAISTEELMEQAKNFVCRSCSTPVPVGHKFCGRCGAAVPPDILAARTQFFGQLQAPGKAKLILIRGEGVEGLSYQLNAEQHIVGRNGQLVFPDDPFVSPKHANLFYRNQKLVVRDEGSLNGVFLRVRGTVELAPTDHFLAGEQLFRLDATPKFNDGPAPDGTYFYSSPKHQTPFRVTQILQGGAPGMVVCARQLGIQIGREGGDMNFPGDLYMSASHCKVDEAAGKFTLTDLNSRNGTYVRLKAERELAHGDYLFIGKKLLRVEITAA